jgi:hypothetical protein
MLICIVALLGLVQQVNSQGQGASASAGAAHYGRVPPGESPASAALAIQDSLKRIAVAQETQANSGKTEEEKKREKEDLEAQQEMALWAKAMFFATLISAVVSVGATVLLYLTLKQSRRATFAALRAAVAGRQSVRVANQSAEKQLRAYINIIDAAASWKEEPPDVTMKIVRVQVNFRNSGSTPAHNVTSWMVARNMWVSAPDFTAEIETTSMGVQGPGGIDHLECLHQAEDVNRGVVAGWKSGSKSLFVFGEIRYTDAFGNPRLTSFRLVMPPEGVGITEGKFQPCREGNTAT